MLKKCFKGIDRSTMLNNCSIYHFIYINTCKR